MAIAPNSNINIPYSEFLNATTGRPNQEWLMWLMNPQFITATLGSALPVTSGGTGLTTIPTNGQLLIGNGSGYTLNPLTPGAGIGVTNGVGLITVVNTGVLSNIAGTGISVSSATGNVTIANTGVINVTGTAPVVSSGGTTPAISMAAATTSVNGYLTSTDWTTFNAKQKAITSGTAAPSGGSNGDIYLQYV